jgi:hypothetical protein
VTHAALRLAGFSPDPLEKGRDPAQIGWHRAANSFKDFAADFQGNSATADDEDKSR